MYQDLKDKIVIVTGGAGSIGQATVRAFLKNGCRVVVVDKKDFEPRLKIQAELIKADLSQPKAAEEAIRQSIEVFGGVDVLVENTFADYLYPIPGQENNGCGAADPEYLCRFKKISFKKKVIYFLKKVLNSFYHNFALRNLSGRFYLEIIL